MMDNLDTAAVFTASSAPSDTAKSVGSRIGSWVWDTVKSHPVGTAILATSAYAAWRYWQTSPKTNSAPTQECPIPVDETATFMGTGYGNGDSQPLDDDSSNVKGNVPGLQGCNAQRKPPLKRTESSTHHGLIQPAVRTQPVATRATASNVSEGEPLGHTIYAPQSDTGYHAHQRMERLQEIAAHPLSRLDAPIYTGKCMTRYNQLTTDKERLDWVENRRSEVRRSIEPFADDSFGLTSSRIHTEGAGALATLVQVARRQSNPELSIEQGIASAIKHAQAVKWRSDEVDEFTTNPLLRPALLRYDECRRTNASIAAACSTPSSHTPRSAANLGAASTSRASLAAAGDPSGERFVEVDNDSTAAESVAEGSAAAVSADVRPAASSTSSVSEASGHNRVRHRFRGIFRRHRKSKPEATQDPDGEEKDDTCP